jgi:Terpene cyclase DEP1
MSMRLLSLVIVLVLFGALSAVALADVGYFGLLAPHFQSWGGAQVLADLVILALLGCGWMVQDARARGTSAWPYVLLTLVGGSFGVLVYLLVRERAAGIMPAGVAGGGAVSAVR